MALVPLGLIARHGLVHVMQSDRPSLTIHAALTERPLALFAFAAPVVRPVEAVFFDFVMARFEFVDLPLQARVLFLQVKNLALEFVE